MTSVAGDHDGGRRAVVAATSGAHFIHDGLIDALNVLLPMWAQLFGLSYAEVGALRTALSAAMASGQIPSGLLGRTDR